MDDDNLTPTQPPKALVVNLRFVTQEHIEPARLAVARANKIHEWLRSQAGKQAEESKLLEAVANCHPDARFNRKTRELIYLAHGSRLWLLWEQGIFDPEKLRFWVKLALAKGHEDWANFTAIDFRGMAIRITAQLAYNEACELSLLVQAKPQNVPEIWRRLYWFTRFDSAFQVQGMTLTPGQFHTSQKQASKALAWKRLAWDYLKTQIAADPRLSVCTIASRFAKQHPGELSVKAVQNYLGDRIDLATSHRTAAKNKLSDGVPLT